MVVQPTGTVTLLFTDIEGSTALLQGLGSERYAQTLDLHRTLLREAFDRHLGYEVDCEGDALFVAFARAGDAVAAAAEAQRALAAAQWPEGLPIRVRMGIHTGEPVAVPPKYVGLDVHKAARITAAGHGGQVLVSAATQRLLDSTVLLREMGEHHLKDLARPEPLYQLVMPGLQVEFPALKTLGNRPNNLPVVATPFIGRATELAEVRELLLRDEVRLLTLTGSGGIGKTRLALQSAADMSDKFRDGVYWVPFASLRDPDLLAPTVAQTLGLREEAGEPSIDTLVRYLADKQLLLVLDNLEHLLLAARGMVAAVLGAAPDIRVLTTSREALRVGAERLYEVAPLTIPSVGDAAEDSDAVALFVSRVRAADSSFVLDAGNALTVVEIVRHLDGLPLAIELAAARVRALPPATLLARLHDRLRLLTSGTHDAEERQRTLRSTIEWSYDLLTPHEQTLFARLGVFVGGCRLETAEAVCGSEAELGISVLDGIASLLDKSLIRRRDDPDEQPRYWMLETIREYAHEQLAGSDDALLVRHRVVEAAVAFAVAADVEWRGVNGSIWLRLFQVELPNLRQAFTLARTEGWPEDALCIASRLAWLWQVNGLASEGIERVETALAECGQLDDEAKAMALLCLGVLASEQGDNKKAIGLLEEASPILAQTRTDLWVYAQYRIASLFQYNHPERAADLLEKAHETAEALDDNYLRTTILDLRASLASHQDMKAARTLAETGVELTRQNHPAAHLNFLATLADYEAADGAYEAALRTAAEADAVAQQERLSWELPHLYRVVAAIAIIRNDLTEANARRERLAAHVASSDRLSDVLALALIDAGLAARTRTPLEAIRLWAHANNLRESFDAHWGATDKRLVERVLEPLRERVSDAEFHQVWNDREE